VVDQLIRETAEGVTEPILGPPLDSVSNPLVSKSPGTMAAPNTYGTGARGQSVP